MSFLRSRPEQLADHLRGAIREGKLREPLPNTRDWARRLGVSCATLYAALDTLEREKWIVIEPRRGVRLSRRLETDRDGGSLRTVRVVYRGIDYPEFTSHSNWWGSLSQRLQAHGIQFAIERCNDARLRALCQPPPRNAEHTELLFLSSLSEQYQRRFMRSGRPCLIVGYPARGVELPFVTCDLEGAIRHATHTLARREFAHVCLLINRVPIHAIQRQCGWFEAACAAWPRQPIRGEIVRVPLQNDAQISCLRAFARRVMGRAGVVVIAPVSLAAAMTTLLSHGVRIPQEVEVAYIETVPCSPLLWPPPIRYQISLDALVSALARAAIHFFETGRVPDVRKTLPIEKADAGLAEGCRR